MKTVSKVILTSTISATILASGMPMASAVSTHKESQATIVVAPVNKTVAKTCELKNLITNKPSGKTVTYNVTYVVKTRKVTSAKLIKHNLGWMSFTLMAIPVKNTVMVTQHYGIFPVNGCTLTV